MALNFPNLTRSFDGTANRIRFWGYDGAMEVQFVIELAALIALRPGTPSTEGRMLAAFDAARASIIEAAGRIYAPRRRQNFYVLTASDF